MREAKRCGTCGSKQFDEEVCSNSRRIAWFIDWLEACGLWPMSALESHSCRSLAGAMNDYVDPSPLQASRVHFCDAHQSCSFEISRKSMLEAINAISSTVDGLDVHKYRTGPTEQ